MKYHSFLILGALLFFAPSFSSYAQAQSEEEQLQQMIESQFDSFTRNYNLDDIQQFYLDSILRNNYTQLLGELQDLKKTGASNSDSYDRINKKWQEITNAALKEKVFTEEQWAKYEKLIRGKEKKKKSPRE